MIVPGWQHSLSFGGQDSWQYAWFLQTGSIRGLVRADSIYGDFI